MSIKFVCCITWKAKDSPFGICANPKLHKEILTADTADDIACQLSKWLYDNQENKDTFSIQVFEVAKERQILVTAHEAVRKVKCKEYEIDFEN